MNEEELIQREVDYILKWNERESSSLCVIYNPDCGCSVDQFVLLDRVPMSPKIISSCPNCKKGCLMEISDPIIFYDPLEEKDIPLNQLVNYVILQSWQEDYIKTYQFIWLLEYLS